MSSTLDTPTQDFVYDLASDATKVLLLPVVSVNPSACFSVASYKVTDNSNVAVAYATTSASHIEINSQDWALSGVQNLIITAVTDNGEDAQPHTFQVTFMDTCNSLVPTISEGPFAGGTTIFNLLQDTSVNVALPAVTVTPAGCQFTTTWAIKRLSDA